MTEARDPDQQHLDRLRRYRNRAEPDLGLGFLKKQFKHDVERPFKQLGELAEHWNELIPAELLEHTRLEGLSRGTLKVAVDSSAHLYELDRLLRSGLQRQLRAAHPKSNLRRVQLHVAAID